MFFIRKKQGVVRPDCVPQLEEMSGYRTVVMIFDELHPQPEEELTMHVVTYETQAARNPQKWMRFSERRNVEDTAALLRWLTRQGQSARLISVA